MIRALFPQTKMPAQFLINERPQFVFNFLVPKPRPLSERLYYVERIFDSIFHNIFTLSLRPPELPRPSFPIKTKIPNFL